MTHRPHLAHAPIPGTEPPSRGLFVKRWGTLLRRPENGGWCRFEAGLFAEGAVDALYRAGQAGWRLYLIGNEEDVAMGRVSDADWETFQDDLLGALAGQGVLIERSYACLDHPEGKGSHRNKSVFQLPDTGLFYHAAQYDSVNLAECWVIGNESIELTAGERAGCHKAGVGRNRGDKGEAMHVEPDVAGDSLAEVLNALTSALIQLRA